MTLSAVRTVLAAAAVTLAMTAAQAQVGDPQNTGAGPFIPHHHHHYGHWRWHHHHWRHWHHHHAAATEYMRSAAPPEGSKSGM